MLTLEKMLSNVVPGSAWLSGSGGPRDPTTGEEGGHTTLGISSRQGGTGWYIALSPTTHSHSNNISLCVCILLFFFFSFFFNLTYSRWTSSLPSCLWSQRILPSLPVHALQFFIAMQVQHSFLQLVNQWLNFTYSRSHTFRYERKNTNPTLVRIELTTSVLTSRCAAYL